MPFDASYPPRLLSVNVYCAVGGGKPSNFNVLAATAMLNADECSRLDAGFEVYGFRRTDTPVALKQ